MAKFYVYIITNKNNTVLYTGFTNDVERRTWEHKEHINAIFTKKYNCNKLVYYEEHTSCAEARDREKRLKRYRRSWKEELINGMNPDWRDLYTDFLA